MITKDMMMEWVGNQGYADKQLEWMANTLVEIANGKRQAFDFERENLTNMQFSFIQTSRRTNQVFFFLI